MLEFFYVNVFFLCIVVFTCDFRCCNSRGTCIGANSRCGSSWPGGHVSDFGLSWRYVPFGKDVVKGGSKLGGGAT